MSTIGMPCLAFVLVLTNFALCLGVDQHRQRADFRRLTSTAVPALPASVERRETAVLTATIPRPTD
jgi:hypothetical protein